MPCHNAPTADDYAQRAASADPTLLIAYVSQGDLYLTDGAGPGRQLYRSGDVTSIYLSGDGALVAFLRRLDGLHHSLWVVPTSGGDARALVSTAHLAAIPTATGADGTEVGQVEWVPNSHAITYSTRPAVDGEGAETSGDRWRVDADTGEEVASPGDLSRPASDVGSAVPPPTCASAESWSASPDHSVLSVSPSPHDLIAAIVEHDPPRDPNIWQLALASCDGVWKDVYERACLIEFDGWAPDGKNFLFEKHVYECDPAFDQGDVDEPADADSVELFIGRPCMIAVGVLPSQYASAGRWLDDDHFVYRTQSTYGGGADTRWQMRLGNVAGTGRLLLEAVGEPVYDFIER
ncbi:MAG: hypothetical protein ABI780_12250 [Ardenticatenales bacterium]